MDWAGSPLSTRDTVETCTPAASAMSTRRDAFRLDCDAAARDSRDRFSAVTRCPPDHVDGGPATQVRTASGGATAVDHQDCAVQIAPAIRGEKGHAVSDLLGGAHPAGRDARRPAGHGRIVMADPVSHR